MHPTDNTPHTVGDPPGYRGEHEAGARARRRNEPLSYNPYSRGTASYMWWAAGWRRPGMYIGGE